MPTFFSPEGNPEVWEARPANYLSEEEWTAAHPDPEPEPPDTETLFSMLRAVRNLRISSTDYLLMPDYPIDDTTRAAVQTYRQALRDLPSKPGAPWDGGGEATPWPALPSTLDDTPSVTSTFLPPSN